MNGCELTRKIENNEDNVVMTRSCPLWEAMGARTFAMSVLIDEVCRIAKE